MRVGAPLHMRSCRLPMAESGRAASELLCARPAITKRQLRKDAREAEGVKIEGAIRPAK